MTKFLDKFYSKLAKAHSEFIILSIIDANPDIHTYEIQQILSSNFSKMNNPIFMSFKLFEDIISKWRKVGKVNDKIDKMIDDIPFIAIRSPLRNYMTISAIDKGSAQSLLEVWDKLRSINFFIVNADQIWATQTGIYQSMKSLEDNKLIEVSRQEIVKGRTRKLYQITEKGKQGALGMLFTLLSFDNIIPPYYPNFSSVLKSFYQFHDDTVFNILKEFDEKGDMHQYIFASNPEFREFNPFIEIQYTLIMQVLFQLKQEEKEEDIFTKLKFNTDSVQNNVLIMKLKNFRDRLDRFIDYNE